ncbi:hypothetical protein UA08_01805 [Talaromyces atroroseus]|uniref:ubiquitinyl hydrolase 1 n=1 Tax=Talaromyces atroroseus TaxID=1441469 RepID=A0A1Q5QBM4_TALAT|nr:hypothetical protein UA08_01805 [Talaromyces atroroseus]OKL63316.1 hypothetical protein UA08_01805 [Talaromyces atroroseus]
MNKFPEPFVASAFPTALPSPITYSSRAATKRAQLTFTTSSTKRRKIVEEPRRPNNSASGARHADAEDRRQQQQQQQRRSHHRSNTKGQDNNNNNNKDTDVGRRPIRQPSQRDDPSRSPSPSLSSSTLSAPPSLPHQPALTLASSNTPRSSGSSPRYVPAHLQDEVLGVASSRASTPAGHADSPSAAYAGLTLDSDPTTDMSSSEKSSRNFPQQEDQRDVRSSSPAVKRRMSQLNQNDQSSDDIEMDNTGASDNHSDAGTSRPAQRRATSVDMIGGDGDAEMADAVDNSPDSVYPTPSSMSTYNSSASTKEGAKMHTTGSEAVLPSIDEQVQRVLELAQKFPEDKQKGYVLSYNWLNRVLARSSKEGGTKPIDKKFAEGEIGPVDNSDIILDTDPTSIFQDEAGEPFVPLRPGLQMNEDFEIVPQAAWDLIMKWYGLAEQSPAIVRYAHNTSEGDATNIQYEISPPIYTVHKLPGASGGISHHALRDKNAAPVKFLASRQTNFQKWLKKAKELAHIDMATKVRVWRVLDGLSSTQTSGVITPAHSRSNSPAPGATLVANAGNSLVLDVNTFSSLSDTHRELIEEAKDQTNNDKYNGKSTVDHFGLGDNAVVVLEEQIGGPGGGEWVSDASKSTLNRLSVPASNRAAGAGKIKSKAITTSGRATPISEPIRGRRKDDRPRGNTGFTNLGNTCYMASALQCVRSVAELSYYFLNGYYKKDLNPSNPLSHNGDVAKAYANLLHAVYDEGPASFSPKQFKHTIGRYGPAFSGYGQQDSQEFLLFLLDGLQEDLNRIQKKPYIEKPDSTDEMVHDHAALKGFADRCWEIYKARNDSVITDLFAGMYKSTLVCPECDKVSIIFDPFNNLTLQLPVENLWSKDIFFFPLHKPPVLIDAELDKNASIKALKELVAKKTGTDPQKLVMAEIYKHKFYKLFDNASTIADSNIQASDDIGIFEVETVPTNYNPDRPKKSLYSMPMSFSSMDHEDVPNIDSPRADRLLVPVFNHVQRSLGRNGLRQLFGAPSFIVVNREEARDYDAILNKVLQVTATLTTRDFLHEGSGDGEAPQDDNTDSDAVIMNEDDLDSDPKVKDASVEGEEGLVDVSMEDAGDSTAQSEDASKQATKSSPPLRFRNLFEMKLIRSKNEVIPLGFSALDEHSNYQSISSRKPKPKAKSKTSARKAQRTSASKESPDSPVSSEDEINSIQKASTQKPSRTSISSNESGRLANDGATDSDDELGVISTHSNEKSSNRAKKQDIIYLYPGEGIVLDWNETSHDGMFGADPKDRNELRGSPTWTNVEHLPDPELAKKRAQRASRRKRGLTLDQCLDEFGREEILSENDAWYCPRCKEHRRASKKFELWKTPDILVIHLKRFSASRGFRDKIDELVDFPIEGLDLNGRVESAEPGESLIYDLFAVDNHYGGLGGGHYTAYAKNFLTDEWNEYNDSHVSKAINPSKVISTAAYLLFYRRRSETPLGGKLLQEITEASTRADSEDNQDDSRTGSPSGEGRRLVDSSRNGSTSALAAVGAVHQAGDGGLPAGLQVRSVEVDSSGGEDNELPPYQKYNHHHHQQQQQAKFSLTDRPAWSFDNISGPPVSDDDGLFDDDDDDDNDSNKAVGGGDMSDLEQHFGGEAGDGGRTNFHSITEDTGAASDGDEDLPVVELRVNEDDRLISE